ncbi:MAG: intradiol ring-cleavage dioxygenase [Acidobacteria bacterium]|nr:MAG: intradiol ring-cleavage dioxygenase [Acidobacteriota bacterium]PYV03162.1 MAG: intradiol ring-cleavage dioxygenase [Acidobacteriota bacterium]PYV33596.1 MAG: intradiol ring-cleavage dioxygenase [Acidobacteriota bacterium]
MNESTPFQTRRLFLRGMTFGAAALGAPGLFSRLFAEELTLTPRQTEGPFYPDHLPLDTDNDLIIVNDGITPAVGEITHLSGRILDSRGDPIRNVLVEIWQVDNNGVYLHTRSNNHAGRDKNFQGFGRFLTGSAGEYYFRTVKPVLYPGRTRHIHFALKMKGREKWTTQCYVKGEPENERDGVFRGIKDPKARESVIVDFAPIKGSRIGELAARFDIVLGFTPEA